MSSSPRVPLVLERDAMAARPEHALTPAAAPAGEQRARTTPLRWFSAMPIALLKDPSVAAESKVLAGLLIAYDGPKGCFPKISSLMKDLGASKHTVIRSLEELERYGFLKRQKRGRNNVYHLTPAYVQPARPDDIALTGELAIENARPMKPVKRKTLHNRRPDPTLPLDVQQVAPVQPIPIQRGKRRPERVASVQPIVGANLDETSSAGATFHGNSSGESVAPEQPGFVAPVQPVEPNRLHRSNLDITKNQDVIYIQQQQEAAADASTTKAEVELALINAGVVPEDAVPWAMDLDGISINDILSALTIMRSKPAYRRREIARPGAYMRVLVNTQVHQDRQLAEHEARKMRPAASQTLPKAPIDDSLTAAPTPTPRVIVARHVDPDDSQVPPIEVQLEALDSQTAELIRARAVQICKGGPASPAWAAALAIAHRQVLQ
jgi:hypothetical protein